MNVSAKDTSCQPELAGQAARALIGADLQFFLNLTFDPALENVRAAAYLTLMPYLSALVLESAKYIGRDNPDAVLVLRPHEDILRASRMRVKLLDADRASFEQMLRSVNDLAAINSSWFYDETPGVLGAIRRLIQPDLGVYFVQDEVISTTHVSFLNLGLTPQDLRASSLSLANIGPYLRNITEVYGRYMRVLAGLVGVAMPVFAPPTSALPRIGYRDLKSSRFYENVAGEVAPSHNRLSILLTWIFSQVNMARMLIPLLSEPSNIAALKIRFISLFHAASSLQSLLTEHALNPLLTDRAAGKIREVLRSEPIRSVRRQHSLRHNLIHYGVDPRMASRLSAELPMYGLIEANSPKVTMSALAATVDAGLDQFSEAFRSFLPPAFGPTHSF